MFQEHLLKKNLNIIIFFFYLIMQMLVKTFIFIIMGILNECWNTFVQRSMNDV